VELVGCNLHPGVRVAAGAGTSSTMCRRMRSIITRSLITAMKRIRPPHRVHFSASTSHTRWNTVAQSQVVSPTCCTAAMHAARARRYHCRAGFHASIALPSSATVRSISAMRASRWRSVSFSSAMSPPSVTATREFQSSPRIKAPDPGRGRAYECRVAPTAHCAKQRQDNTL
jgi:hypothetical protein